MLNFNSIINFSIRETILSEEDPSAYDTKYILWYICIAIEVIYFIIRHFEYLGNNSLKSKCFKNFIAYSTYL